MNGRAQLTRLMTDIAPRTRAATPIAHLSDVQFWLMGRDVEHPDGNLLVRLGFARERAPQPTLPTRYRRTDARRPVFLWPCGLLLDGGAGSCLLVRGHEPAHVPDLDPECLYDPQEVIAELRHGRACPPEVLAHACRWFADYERAVDTTAGVGHRVPRPGSRPSLAPEEPCSLEPAWSELATTIAAATHRDGPARPQ